MAFSRLAAQSLRKTHKAARFLGTHASTSALPISSVNPAEISLFSGLSAEWWDEQGEFTFLHKMNPVRMQFVREKLLEIAREGSNEQALQMDPLSMQGMDVLDVGCGGGLFSESLARLGARTLGIDASLSNISIASIHASADPRLVDNLMYRHTSAEELLEQEPGKQYDAVCSMEVLEHVDNPRAFLDTCAKLVKPGGHLFLSTISRTPLAYLLTIFTVEHLLRRVTVGTHSYSKFVKPEELTEFFQSYRSPAIPSASPPLTWIRPTPTPRLISEARGMMYVPWKGAWTLAPRFSAGTTDCNYLFWVRRPFE